MLVRPPFHGITTRGNGARQSAYPIYAVGLRCAGKSAALDAGISGWSGCMTALDRRSVYRQEA